MGPAHAAQLLELATVLAGSNNAHLSSIEDNGRWKLVGDPTEGAMLAAAHKAGARHDAIDREFPKHHEIVAQGVRLPQERELISQGER